MLEWSEELVDRQVRGKYTLEYKLEAVRQVKAGQSAAVVAKVLGIPPASLSNWVLLDAKGQLSCAKASQKAPVVSPEQKEIARLRAENAQLKMERDIEKYAAAYTLRRMCFKARLGIRQMSGEIWPVSLICVALEVSQRVLQLEAHAGWAWQ
jgi:transposase